MTVKEFYKDTLLLTSVMFLDSTALERKCCPFSMTLQRKLQVAVVYSILRCTITQVSLLW